MIRRISLLLAGLAVFLVALYLLPSWWCGRQAPDWMEGKLDTQQKLARTVRKQVERKFQLEEFHTGHKLFAAEWLFGSYLMAGIGFCQIVQQHPETFAEYSPAIELCIDELLSERVRAFDTRSWENDALATLDQGEGHAAYLGYLNFLLSLYSELWPDNRFRELNDRISAALLQRLQNSKTGLVPTYPGQWYPVDNAPLLASLILHEKLTGEHPGSLEALLANYSRWAVDEQTGLLTQALGSDGLPRDYPRGSGTALAIFFLRNQTPDLTRKLFNGLEKNLRTSIFGFAAVREYPNEVPGRGDIDSGPVICGLGFSATGFSLAGARILNRTDFFRRLYASAYLAGAPVSGYEEVEFVTGGPLGNAILLAVLTAPRMGQ